MSGVILIERTEGIIPGQRDLADGRAIAEVGVPGQPVSSGPPGQIASTWLRPLPIGYNRLVPGVIAYWRGNGER
jgi:hypothetical protein